MPNVVVDDFEAGEMATTSEPSTQDQALNDCLLHGQHHAFDINCWDYFIGYYLRIRSLYNYPHERIIEHYCLEYESRLLNDIWRNNAQNS
jgi:hypothetical protein